MTATYGPEDARGRIAALLSPCGTGNLGDAAIQEAMLCHLRQLSPRAKFIGITLSPTDTETRHGVPGFPIDIFRREIAFDTEPKMLDEAQLSFFPAGLRLLRAHAHALTADPNFPYNSGVSRFSRTIRRLNLELRHFFLALRLFRYVDVLIICGGGQLDDLWGGARQHPWALFKWTLAAKIRRRSILMTSVGAGRLRSHYSRWLVRRALRCCAYVTCRDRRSARVVARLVGRTVAVIPDLALDYPMGTDANPASYDFTLGNALHVGVAPMVFGDSRFWPEKHPEQFRDYLAAVTETARRLAEGGARVTIFSTTPADARVANEVYEAVHASVTRQTSANLMLTTPTTVESLIGTLRSVDVVMASRLHALILATDCLRPLVAIACEWKVERFLADLGLSEHCHRFTEARSSELHEDVLSVAAQHGRISAQLSKFRTQAQAQLLLQYQIVATILDGGTVPAMARSQAR